VKERGREEGRSKRDGGTSKWDRGGVATSTNTRAIARTGAITRERLRVGGGKRKKRASVRGEERTRPEERGAIRE
jgi:hypothetical protein